MSLDLMGKRSAGFPMRLMPAEGFDRLGAEETNEGELA